MWTGKIGDPTSEPFRARDLRGLRFRVLAVHRTSDFTQVQVADDVTALPVWINVWARYNGAGRARGVTYATVLR